MKEELPKYPSAVSKRTGEVINPKTHLFSSGEAFMMNEAKKQFSDSQKLEEWNKFIRSAVETKSAIFHMYENGDGKAEMESLIAMLQLFIKTEIRKAEERGKQSILDDIEHEQKKFLDGFSHSKCKVCEVKAAQARASLEALKK